MRIIIISVLALLVGLALWRGADRLADRREWARLRAAAPVSPARFDPAMLDGLPEPARRYLSFAIAEGALLTPVAELTMTGTFRLGDASQPRAMAMSARQILAPPHGFIWRMSAKDGVMRIGGSDSGAWTRFWLMGLIPVARVGRGGDHDRSALGRQVIEAVLWTPVAALPGPGVRWEEAGPDTARVVFTLDGHDHVVDLSLLPNGQPTRAVIARWSDVNPDRMHRLQPFGGDLLAFGHFDGFTIPTRVRIGHFPGTEAFFPFFEAEISEARFLTSGH